MNDVRGQGSDQKNGMDLEGHHRAVFVISVAAELGGVHPQTLRVYERKGLLSPARTGGMSRRYSQADIDQIHRIQELTTQGLNLAGVKRVLLMETEIVLLHQQIAELRAQGARPTSDLVPLHQDVVRYRPDSGRAST